MAKFPHRSGLCHWCTFWERVKKRIGMKHPMHPDKVFHDISAWKYTTGYAVLNDRWIVKIEDHDGKQ